jgi:hypothetical protein
MAMGRVELASKLLNQGIHYASEPVNPSESQAVQDLKARRVRMLLASVDAICPERPTHMPRTESWEGSQSGGTSPLGASGSSRPTSAGSVNTTTSQNVLAGMGNMGIQGHVMIYWLLS